MLQPKKIRRRKVHRSKIKGVTSRGYYLSFGVYGLKSLGSAWITSAQIESARRAITRSVQKGGKLWIRIFPDLPRTKKGAEVGMGGGAGSLDKFIAPIRPGKIIFEIDGITAELAKKALTLAAHKLPVKTKFIKK